jgi:hypothetical protein
VEPDAATRATLRTLFVAMVRAAMRGGS